MLERRRDRGTLRLPLDSLAIAGRHDGRLRSRVIAETLADDLAAILGRSRHLRVPRAEFVASYAETERTPEEIGRELSVRGVALLMVAAEAPRINVAVELIDVHREELVARDQFLVSPYELMAVEREIIRALVAHCVISDVPSRHPLSNDEEEYARLVEARFARAAGATAEALAILDTIFTPAAALEFAAAVVEGGVSTRADEARARLAETRSASSLLWEAKLRIRFDDDWNGAEEALRYAIALDPVSPHARAILAELLLANGNAEEAEVHRLVIADLMPLGLRDIFPLASHRIYPGCRGASP
jgi:TolB-like protein